MGQLASNGGYSAFAQYVDASDPTTSIPIVDLTYPTLSSLVARGYSKQVPACVEELEHVASSAPNDIASIAMNALRLIHANRPKLLVVSDGVRVGNGKSAGRAEKLVSLNAAAPLAKSSDVKSIAKYALGLIDQYSCEELVKSYDPNEPRDEDGRWSEAGSANSTNSSLLPHQQRVVDRMRNHNTGLVVAHGLGSGKTRTALAVQQDLGAAADVLSPASLIPHWEEQVGRWGSNPADVHITSQQQASRTGLEGHASLLIVDEGHRGRNPETNLSSAISGSEAKQRLILTGTPLYNRPEDLATLVNQAAGKEVLPEGKAFAARYLNPGLWDRILGRKFSNTGELRNAIRNYVDFYEGVSQQKIQQRTVEVTMGPAQSKLYQRAIDEIPPGLRGALSSSDVSDADLAKLRPYLTGPRMISNTTASVGASAIEEPKIDRAVSDLKSQLARNPNGGVLIYSNFLAGGVNRIQAKLDEAKIPYGLFTGEEKTSDRVQAVRDYNAGKVKVLLVSSSGGEGLDLKGTRMVQVLEPHFNEAKIEQIIGRASRLGSHSHLPESERTVEVVRYVAKPRGRWFGSNEGVDDYLTVLSARKQEIHRQLLGMMAEEQKKQEARKAEALDAEMRKLPRYMRMHKSTRNPGHLRDVLQSFADQQSSTLQDKIGRIGPSASSVELHRAVDSLDWTPLASQIQPYIRDYATRGGLDALESVQASTPATRKQVFDASVDFAKDRSAEIIGHKWIRGKLLPDDTAEYAINRTATRELHSIVDKGEEEGWTNEQTADALGQAKCFRSSRVDLIANTEIERSIHEGKPAGFKAAGVERVDWILSPEHSGACSCASIAQGSPYDVDDIPPLQHPGCHCKLVAEGRKVEEPYSRGKSDSANELSNPVNA